MTHPSGSATFGDLDADLEALQSDFFGSGKRPAVKLVRVSRDAETPVANAGTEAGAERGSAGPEEPEVRTAGFVPGLLSDVVERMPGTSKTTSDPGAPPATKATESAGFPQAFHRSTRSFKARVSEFKKRREAEPAEQPGNTETKPLSVEDYFKLKAIPRANPGDRTQNNDSDLGAVNEENIARLASMTEADFKEAQDELAQMDSRLIDALKKLALKRYGTSKEANDEGQVANDVVGSLVASAGSKDGVNPAQSAGVDATGTPNHEHAHVDQGPRYDLSGEILSNQTPHAAIEHSVHVGMHHHSAEDPAGLSLPDLANLARSSYAAQRAMALRTLAKIVAKAWEERGAETMESLVSFKIADSAVHAATQTNVNVATAGSELFAALAGASLAHFDVDELGWDAVALVGHAGIDPSVPASLAQSKHLYAKYTRHEIADRELPWLAEGFGGPASPWDVLGSLLDRSLIPGLHRILLTSIKEKEKRVPLVHLRLAVALSRHTPQFASELCEHISDRLAGLAWPGADSDTLETAAYLIRLLRISFLVAREIDQMVLDRLVAMLALPWLPGSRARFEALMFLGTAVSHLQDHQRSVIVDILSSGVAWQGFIKAEILEQAALMRLAAAVVSSDEAGKDLGLAVEIATRLLGEVEASSVQTSLLVASGAQFAALFLARFPDFSLEAETPLAEHIRTIFWAIARQIDSDLGQTDKHDGTSSFWDVKDVEKIAKHGLIASLGELLLALEGPEGVDGDISDTVTTYAKRHSELASAISRFQASPRGFIKQLLFLSPARRMVASWIGKRRLESGEHFGTAYMIGSLCLPTEHSLMDRIISKNVFEGEAPEFDDALLPLPLAWPASLLKHMSLQQFGHPTSAISHLLRAFAKVESGAGGSLLAWWALLPVGIRRGAIIGVFLMDVEDDGSSADGDKITGSPAFLDVTISELLLEVFRRPLFQTNAVDYDRIVFPQLLEVFLSTSYGDRTFALYVLRCLTAVDAEWWKDFWNKVLDASGDKWALLFRAVDRDDPDVQTWKSQLQNAAESADEELLQLLSRAVLMARGREDQSTEWANSLLFEVASAAVERRLRLK